jgi:hypothetical protein
VLLLRKAQQEFVISIGLRGRINNRIASDVRGY